MRCFTGSVDKLGNKLLNVFTGPGGGRSLLFVFVLSYCATVILAALQFLRVACGQIVWVCAVGGGGIIHHGPAGIRGETGTWFGTKYVLFPLSLACGASFPAILFFCCCFFVLLIGVLLLSPNRSWLCKPLITLLISSSSVIFLSLPDSWLLGSLLSSLLLLLSFLSSLSLVAIITAVQFNTQFYSSSV